MNRLQSIFSGHGNSSDQAGSSGQTATPEYSPPPPDVQADLRKVRWGSNDVVPGQHNPYASDDESEPGESDNGAQDDGEVELWEFCLEPGER